MKKLLVIFAVMLFAGTIFGQDVLQQFMYTDYFGLITPLYDVDGITPIPDGYAIHVCLTNTPDVYDFANDPHGNMLNNIWAEDTMNGGMLLGMEGFFLTMAYFNWEDDLGSPPEPVANCLDQAYLRIYNNADPALADWFRHSEFIVGPAPGSGTSELEVGVWGAWEQPVPVTLTAFQATMQGEFAAISWTTESESDMSIFNIYRDDLLIHTEDATNGTETTTYEFIDTEVVDGEEYDYDLEAKEQDGTALIIGSITFTIEIDPDPVYSEITALYNNYPNPFKGTTAIKYAVKEGKTATLTIYNAKGQIVDTYTLDQTNINGAEQIWNAETSGIYFYKLESEGVSQVKKMLVLK